MPKRKLLSEMSKRHYRRLKCNARNIAISENENKLPIDVAKIDDVHNSSDVITQVITDVDCDLDQATNVALKTEPLQQYIYNISDNENVAGSSDLMDLLCPIALTFNNEENVGCTSSSAALSITDDLRNWAVQFQISHTAVTALLSILRKHGFDNYLPKICKTLLKTPRNTNVRRVAPGEYFHNGLRLGIMAFLQKSQDDVDSVEVQISIDGLPISNSSTNQLWPILGSVLSSPCDIFVIGCYFGSTKPNDCNEFLRDFVDEAKILVTEGLEYEGKHISVSIHSLIADAPAKSFIIATKGHTGYFSCVKCTTQGEYIHGRMCFPDINCRKRTNESFLKQIQPEHHNGWSILSDIPNFGMITHIPLDYMHLVCIGVVKKILNFWLSGPLNVRLPTRTVSSISKLLIEIRTSIPIEFVRKPRELHFLSLWKATELRQFLLYSGPIILKNYITEDIYKNFLTLHVAIRLLCSSDLLHIDYAESLLEHFVQSFAILYGPQYISHNIHALTHLADDVRKFGTLDTFSSFRYENYLKRIKHFLRKAERPLQQIHNRLTELEHCLLFQKEHLKIGVHGTHDAGPILPGINSPQYSTFSRADFTLSIYKPNNCCALSDGSIVIIENIATTTANDLCIIGRKFIGLSNLYTEPCNSSLLGIYKSTGCENLLAWPLTSITKKYVKFNLYNSNTFVLIPLLHNVCISVFYMFC